MPAASRTTTSSNVVPPKRSTTRVARARDPVGSPSAAGVGEAPRPHRRDVGGREGAALDGRLAGAVAVTCGPGGRAGRAAGQERDAGGGERDRHEGARAAGVETKRCHRCHLTGTGRSRTGAVPPGRCRRTSPTSSP